MTARTWGQWTSSIARVVAETALATPPLETDVSRTRLLYALSELCCSVYDVTSQDVGGTTVYVLPLKGQQGGTACVTAKLVHVRDSDGAVGGDHMVVPQKFGVWDVEGLGVVVAFRGTASAEDMMVNLQIQPTALRANGQATDAVQLHRGFYEGCRQHLEDITGVVAQLQASKGGGAPLWLCGHSLGGGYATTALLHLLANDASSALFSAGGGLVTFGAPMVMYSTAPAASFAYLQQLQQRKPYISRLSVWHVVNSGDMIPRLLGTSLAQLHTTLQYYFPSLQAVRDVAVHYQPCGMYYFITNGEISRLAFSTDPVATASSHAPFGDASYGQRVVAQLELYRSLPALVASMTLRPRAAHFHSMLSYVMDVKQYTAQLAADSAPTTDETAGDKRELFTEGVQSGAGCSDSGGSSSSTRDLTVDGDAGVLSAVLQNGAAFLASGGASKLWDVYQQYRGAGAALSGNQLIAAPLPSLISSLTTATTAAGAPPPLPDAPATPTITSSTSQPSSTLQPSSSAQPSSTSQPSSSVQVPSTQPSPSTSAVASASSITTTSSSVPPQTGAATLMTHGETHTTPAVSCDQLRAVTTTSCDATGVTTAASKDQSVAVAMCADTGHSDSIASLAHQQSTDKHDSGSCASHGSASPAGNDSLPGHTLLPTVNKEPQSTPPHALTDLLQMDVTIPDNAAVPAELTGNSGQQGMPGIGGQLDLLYIGMSSAQHTGLASGQQGNNVNQSSPHNKAYGGLRQSGQDITRPTAGHKQGLPGEQAMALDAFGLVDEGTAVAGGCVQRHEPELWAVGEGRLHEQPVQLPGIESRLEEHTLDLLGSGEDPQLAAGALGVVMPQDKGVPTATHGSNLMEHTLDLVNSGPAAAQAVQPAAAQAVQPAAAQAVQPAAAQAIQPAAAQAVQPAAAQAVQPAAAQAVQPAAAQAVQPIAALLDM